MQTFLAIGTIGSMPTHPRATNAGRRTASAADAVLLADAAQLAPQLRAVLEEEADRRGLSGVERAEWVAAIAIILGSGELNAHLSRQAAVEHERLHDGSPAAAHEALGSRLGISRQAVEQRLGLTGDAGRALRDQVSGE